MSIIDASIVEILHMMQKEKRKPCLPEEAGLWWKISRP